MVCVIYFSNTPEGHYGVLQKNVKIQLSWVEREEISVAQAMAEWRRMSEDEPEFFEAYVTGLDFLRRCNVEQKRKKSGECVKDFLKQMDTSKQYWLEKLKLRSERRYRNKIGAWWLHDWFSVPH